MRLLLTRSLDDAHRTGALLEAAGHSVLYSPVIAFHAVDHDWPAGTVDAIAATSGQAFWALNDSGSPPPEVRRVLPVYVVGERSAELARQCGFTGAFSVQRDAASLATAIADSHPSLRRVVYAAGRDRKSTLELGLAALGIRVETIVVYEARDTGGLSPAAIEALGTSRIDGVLHFSQRSALLFKNYVEKAGLDAKPAIHFCLSEDVARVFYDASCDKIVVAREPTEASLIATLSNPANDQA